MEIFSVPLMTVVRPCGRAAPNAFDQTTVGGGKPDARQETDAIEFSFTFTILSGVSINCGGTGHEKANKTKNNKLCYTITKKILRMIHGGGQYELSLSGQNNIFPESAHE